VESDLSRYHNIDYRDRWRFDADGVRRLTLRMINVRLKHLPADSATAIADGGDGWTLSDHMRAHIYGATAGEKHPWMPEHKKQITPEMQKARKAALARKRARDQAIAEGLIT
jgi:hypothetical protein